MLLHLLDDAQKSSFLVIAHKLTMADGEDASSEEHMLVKLRAEMGGIPEAPMAAVLGPIDVRPFDSRQARVAAMLELLALAYTDDYMHEAESNLIGDVAMAFGFTQDELNAMAEWAWRRLDLGPAPAAEHVEMLVRDARTLMAT